MSFSTHEPEWRDRRLICKRLKSALSASLVSWSATADFAAASTVDTATSARTPPESCWEQGLTYDMCCNAIFGERGDANCWDDQGHTFEVCCSGRTYRPRTCAEFVSQFSFGAIGYRGDSLERCTAAMAVDRPGCDSAGVTPTSCPACAGFSQNLLEYVSCVRREQAAHGDLNVGIKETKHGGFAHGVTVGGLHFPTLLRPRSPGRDFTYVAPAFDAYVGSQLIHYGRWMPQEETLLMGFVPQGGVVVDAGANIGGFTLPFARWVGPLGEVHSFEPFRLLYQQLTANCALNGLQSCFTHHKALGSQQRQRRLRSPGLNGIGNPSKMFVAEQVASEMHVNYDRELEETVEVVRLDDVSLTRVDLIKIDVESMELDVLRGAEKTIRRFRPILYVEDSEAEDLQNMNAPTQVIQLLWKTHSYGCLNPVQSGFVSMTSLLCGPAERMHGLMEYLNKLDLNAPNTTFASWIPKH